MIAKRDHEAEKMGAGKYVKWSVEFGLNLRQETKGIKRAILHGSVFFPPF